LQTSSIKTIFHHCRDTGVARGCNGCGRTRRTRMEEKLGA